ncbi:hypothetical protein [Sphingomonas sp.]|uniref:hypothetical protein n=1 Tax=Sphingomonas sp. TaxID=28214 RepID=UPI0035C849B8
MKIVGRRVSVGYRLLVLLAICALAASTVYALMAVAVAGPHEPISVAIRLFYVVSPVICGFLLVRGVSHGSFEPRQAFGHLIGATLVPLVPWALIGLMLLFRAS